MEEASGGIADFLAQRYDEAEALATHAGRADWQLHARERPIEWDVETSGYRWVAKTLREEDGRFIAANPPNHRLADIALKRAILAEHAPEAGLLDRAICRVCWTVRRNGGPLDGDPYPCPTVRQLGTEFDNHPDYRAEWKP